MYILYHKKEFMSREIFRINKLFTNYSHLQSRQFVHKLDIYEQNGVATKEKGYQLITFSSSSNASS
jgi:hypothetical protein